MTHLSNATISTGLAAHYAGYAYAYSVSPLTVKRLGHGRKLHVIGPTAEVNAVREWLDENVSPDDQLRDYQRGAESYGESRFLLMLSRDEDAVLFKLRWGDHFDER
jgi:hypothetical protein